MSLLWSLQLQTNQYDADMLGAALEPYVLAVSWYEHPKNEAVWVVEATTKEKPDLGFMQLILDAAAQLAEMDAPEMTLQPIEEQDWLEATWRNFPPITIGGFYVYGSHAKSEVPQGLRGIEINAATAFGSGEHETTRGCLTALSDLEKTHFFRRILDMGCGSGILGIAAAKLWRVPILAADCDPESVRVTAGNVKLNQVENYVIPVCSDGFSDTAVQDRGPYDLIVANILAKPLCDMAPEMVANLTSDGKIVLSGLLKRQVSEVLSAYQAQGAVLEREIAIQDWATLVLTKLA